MQPPPIGEQLVCTMCQKNGFASKGFEVYVRWGAGGSGRYLTFICISCQHHETMDFENPDYDR